MQNQKNLLEAPDIDNLRGHTDRKRVSASRLTERIVKYVESEVVDRSLPGQRITSSSCAMCGQCLEQPSHAWRVPLLYMMSSVSWAGPSSAGISTAMERCMKPAQVRVLDTRTRRKAVRDPSFPSVSFSLMQQLLRFVLRMQVGFDDIAGSRCETA